jgi:hypothetical protein
MPVISALWGVEIDRRISVQGQPGQKQDPIWKKKKLKQKGLEVWVKW